MPTDSLIVSIAVTATFLIFAVTLYWGDRRTGRL